MVPCCDSPLWGPKYWITNIEGRWCKVLSSHKPAQTYLKLQVCVKNVKVDPVLEDLILYQVLASYFWLLAESSILWPPIDSMKNYSNYKRGCIKCYGSVMEMQCFVHAWSILNLNWKVIHYAQIWKQVWGFCWSREILQWMTSMLIAVITIT